MNRSYQQKANDLQQRLCLKVNLNKQLDDKDVYRICQPTLLE